MKGTLHRYQLGTSLPYTKIWKNFPNVARKTCLVKIPKFFYYIHKHPKVFIKIPDLRIFTGAIYKIIQTADGQLT